MLLALAISGKANSPRFDPNHPALIPLIPVQAVAVVVALALAAPSFVVQNLSSKVLPTIPAANMVILSAGWRGSIAPAAVEGPRRKWPNPYRRSLFNPRPYSSRTCDQWQSKLSPLPSQPSRFYPSNPRSSRCRCSWSRPCPCSYLFPLPKPVKQNTSYHPRNQFNPNHLRRKKNGAITIANLV